MAEVIDQGKWGGVCGFVSVIHGLRQRGPITGLRWFKKKAEVVEMSTDDLEAKLGAEMITYLKMTQVERPAVADAIVRFTRTWGGVYAALTMNQIIQQITTTVMTKHANNDWKCKNSLGCALPPEAVEDYLDFVGLKHKRVLNGVRMPFTKQAMGQYKDCVVGTGASSEAGNGYNGLRHWVYVTKKGVMYNWAKETTMDGSVDEPYDGHLAVTHDMIVYAIKLK
jgi:hypothetical protein